MPLELECCKGCGRSDDVCPECGSSRVTPMDGSHVVSPNDMVIYGEADEYTFTNVCWDCGWSEEVAVTIERE